MYFLFLCLHKVSDVYYIENEDDYKTFKIFQYDDRRNAKSFS